jgi:drug/metabolite transporter (DMT)-like permease
MLYLPLASPKLDDMAPVPHARAAWRAAGAVAMNRSILAALTAAALFGLSTPLAKGLAGTIHPVMLAGLLYAGSGVGLSALMMGRIFITPRVRTAIAWPRHSDIGWLIAAVLIGGVVGPVLLMFGLARIPASTASLLLNGESVLTALFAWFIFREHFDARIATGMALIVAGGIALAWSGNTATLSLGALLVLGACACWALDNNLTRKVAAGDAMLIACVKGLAAGAVNIVIAMAMGFELPSPVGLAEVAAVGFICFGVSLALFIVALRGLGAGRTGAYFSAAPFLGAAFALAVNDDPVTAQLVIAGVLMGAGVWLHLSERHEHMHTHLATVHEHSRVHDSHHRHVHGADWDGREPHTHRHVHAPMSHGHPHFPDIHHQHDH